MPTESLKLHAYNCIKHKIATCEYAPGSLLNEELLREEIGVSRTPIRDALSRLEQEGLITIMPKKGVMVTGLSISDINMIFEVRLLFEPYAVRNYGFTLPQETMLGFYNRFLLPCSALSEEDFFNLDNEFHLAIVHAMPNRFLLQAYDMIHTQNLRFRMLTGHIHQRRLEETQHEHMEIITACLHGEWDTAGTAMREHLVRSKAATFNLLIQANPDETRV